jgi:hypothetical protein
MKILMKSLLLVAAIVIASPSTYAQVSIGIGITANIAPPPIPVYEQPECPEDGYLWTPGYWAYDPADGYYWVPGAWVAPPATNVILGLRSRRIWISSWLLGASCRFLRRY